MGCNSSKFDNLEDSMRNQIDRSRRKRKFDIKKRSTPAQGNGDNGLFDVTSSTRNEEDAEVTINKIVRNEEGLASSDEDPMIRVRRELETSISLINQLSQVSLERSTSFKNV